VLPVTYFIVARNLQRTRRILCLIDSCCLGPLDPEPIPPDHARLELPPEFLVVTATLPLCPPLRAWPPLSDRLVATRRTVDVLASGLVATLARLPRLIR